MLGPFHCCVLSWLYSIGTIIPELDKLIDVIIYTAVENVMHIISNDRIDSNIFAHFITVSILLFLKISNTNLI